MESHGRQRLERKKGRKGSVEGSRLEISGCCRSGVGWIMWGVRERLCGSPEPWEEEKIPQGSTTAQAMTFAVGSLLLGDMENQLL